MITSEVFIRYAFLIPAISNQAWIDVLARNGMNIRRTTVAKHEPLLSTNSTAEVRLTTICEKKCNLVQGRYFTAGADVDC